MTRAIRFSEDEFFHVYNRGVEKRNIFLDNADYLRFTSLLYLCNSNKPVHLQLQGRTLKGALEAERGERLLDIVAYCLMPNHFHLLIKETSESGISKFMQKLSTGYTMYFNKRYERNGVLFQGKFKATHASDDRYLRYLFSYIHLNPVKLIDPAWKENGIKDKEKATSYLNQYHHSSYLTYKNTGRDESVIIEKSSYPYELKSISELEDEMREWLDFKVEP